LASIRTRALQGVKWTTVSTIMVTLVQIIQLIVLARLLLPQDFGLMAIMSILIGFAQAYTDLGVSAAIIYRQDVNREQLSSLYWLNIVAGITVFLIMIAGCPIFVAIFKEVSLYQLLPVVGLTFVISPWGIQFQMLLQKELKFDLLAWLEMSSAFLGTAAAIIAAFMGQGVWSLVWGQLTSISVKTILLMIIGWKRWKPMLHFCRNDLTGYIGFGLFQMAERSLNYLVSRVDQLIIGTLLGSQALGYYNFAYRLAIEPVYRINPIITRVAFPVFSLVQDDILKLQRGYLYVMKFLSTANAPVCLGICAVAPIAVPLIFGSQWQPAIILVQIIAINGYFRSTGNPVGSLLLAKGHADWEFYWTLLNILVVVPVVWLGVQTGGLIGAAIAVTAAEGLSFFPNYFFLVQKLIGKCGAHYFSSFAGPFFYGCLMAAPVFIMGHFIKNPLTAFVAQVSAGIALYALFIWVFDRSLYAVAKSFLYSKSNGDILE
jgi:lipopolysaccharide exporter